MKKYFETLTDPRQQAKVLYNFVETIMVVICAVIAGCDVWEDIADYCRVRRVGRHSGLLQGERGVVQGTARIGVEERDTVARHNEPDIQDVGSKGVSGAFC